MFHTGKDPVGQSFKQVASDMEFVQLTQANC